MIKAVLATEPEELGSGTVGPPGKTSFRDNRPPQTTQGTFVYPPVIQSAVLPRVSACSKVHCFQQRHFLSSLWCHASRDSPATIHTTAQVDPLTTATFSHIFSRGEGLSWCTQNMNGPNKYCSVPKQHGIHISGVFIGPIVKIYIQLACPSKSHVCGVLPLKGAKNRKQSKPGW